MVMIIDGKAYIDEIKTVDSPEPEGLHTSLTARKIITGSVADIAGIRSGDYLIRVNDTPANEVDFSRLAILCTTAKYVFYQPSKQCYLELFARTIPLGIEFVKSNETVLHEYTKDVQLANHVDLYPVWNARNWEMLKKITDTAFMPVVMWLNCLVKAGFYSPEYLFSGAALYDAGDRKKGMQRIKCFSVSSPQSHTQEQSAVVNYYFAQEMLNSNDPDGAVELLYEAFNQHPYERIADDIEKLTGERPVADKYWPGREFPANYNLQRVIFGEGWVRLSQELGAMRDDQLFVICMLNGYRVNRFYNAFMYRFHGYQKCFPDLVYGLHVISSDPWQENHPDYFVYEKEYMDEMGEINLLHDPDWELWQKLDPHGSPAIYVLDKNGMIYHEGELLETDFCHVLEKFSRD